MGRCKTIRITQYKLLEKRKQKSTEAVPEKPAEKQITEVRASRAPAPIQTLDGKSATVVKDPSQMTVSELREYRMQEMQKRAASGR